MSEIDFQRELDQEYKLTKRQLLDMCAGVMIGEILQKTEQTPTLEEVFEIRDSLYGSLTAWLELEIENQEKQSEVINKLFNEEDN